MGIALAGASAAAGAQTKDAAYPSKPIRCIIPFPPGGTADIQARMLFERLVPRIGQQVIIDNRGGANGSIGMELTARAPADGYTIVLATVGTWVINPYLYKLSYDVLDFAPIVHVGTTPGVLVVHPSLPVRSVKELIACTSEIRRAHLRLRRHRRLRPHVGRALFGNGEGEDVARPLQGDGPVHSGPARRAHSDPFQQRRAEHASHQERQGTRARQYRRKAHGAAAGLADDR